MSEIIFKKSGPYSKSRKMKVIVGKKVFNKSYYIFKDEKLCTFTSNHQRWKFSTISGRSDFRKVSWFSFYFKSQIWTGRTEIRVHIFIFFQNANLAVQIFGKVFTFSFLMKIKMWTPFLSKSVQKRCSHFDFHQKRKCEHLFKNLDGQICDLKKLKMWTPFQKSGRPDLRF